MLDVSSWVREDPVVTITDPASRLDGRDTGSLAQISRWCWSRIGRRSATLQAECMYQRVAHRVEVELYRRRDITSDDSMMTCPLAQIVDDAEFWDGYQS